SISPLPLPPPPPLFPYTTLFRSLRPRPDLEPRRIEVERLRVDVDEHRLRPRERDDVRRRRERVRGHDHLVPRPESEREHREMERRRSRRNRRRVGDAAGARHELLELADLRAHRQHPGLEHLGHRLELALAERRIAQPDPAHRDRLRRGSRPNVSVAVAGFAAAVTKRLRYHSMVRASPSSRSTFASKPSSSRASSTFGLRI